MTKREFFFAVYLIVISLIFIGAISLKEDKVTYCRIESGDAPFDTNTLSLIGVRQVKPNVNIYRTSSITDAVKVAKEIGCPLEFMSKPEGSEHHAN